MKIIFSGGGTLGPVAPLLGMSAAIASKYPECQFIWVGTKNGPEREMVTEYRIPFFVISSGKLRRYFSLWNFFDCFKIILAFFQSCYLIVRERPNLLISAGGFVSVPLHWAGALFGIPSWVHQQDVRVGLANRLMMPFASKITTALEATAQEIKRKNVEWIGNPTRDLSVTPEEIEEFREECGIPQDAHVIFALGGGTGSASVNQILLDALTHWPADWHIVHLVGKERPKELAEHAAKLFPNYHVYPFFTYQMAPAYATADVVIARAGFSTLSELAALSKAAIILPMYDTHQEDNAQYLLEHGGILTLEKGTNHGLRMAHDVLELVEHPEVGGALGNRLHELLPSSRVEKIIQIFEEIKL